MAHRRHARRLCADVLQGLAREVNLDKSQASRTVSDMIERGLLQRESDESDGRGVQLSLTAQERRSTAKSFRARSSATRNCYRCLARKSARYWTVRSTC